MNSTLHRVSVSMWASISGAALSICMGHAVARSPAERVAAPAAIPGTWEEDCECYRNIDYGPETWKEAGRQLKQDFDFWPAAPGARNQPLIIFAHPGTQSKTIEVELEPDGPNNYTNLIVPARKAGFAVASIDFRHPVSNDYIVPAPHEDIVRVIQYLRARDDQLGIDRRNIFLMGSSRGTLTAWTATQDDARDPYDGYKPRRQTSLVNAVYVYNAQTTYRGEEMAARFIVPEEQALFVASWLTLHPQNSIFGSTIASVSPSDPPIWLNYEGAFYNRPVTIQEFSPHHPDYGPALCAAYDRAGIGERCQAHDSVPQEEKWSGFVKFFNRHMYRR